MYKKCHFDTRIFKILPTVGRGGGDYPHPHPPLLGRSAPSLWPLLKNSGYTTGTDGAKKAQ